MKKIALLISILCLFIIVLSCKKEETKALAALETTIPTEAITKPEAFKPSKEFNDYWYAGEAEISSYKLEQSRYGEIRNGSAVLVFVTEPFLPKKQVKADYSNPSNINVLKLNRTKNFVTGIYPYSIMQSTFFPIENNQHAIKVSSSVQEWCGHAFTQLNNREQFEIDAHSYFESEADTNFKLDKALLENEIWTQLRIDPKSLPVGDIAIIPSLEYIQLNHKPIKPYKAFSELKNYTYTINYTNLNRKLTINFNPEFPHDILSWEESINGNSTKASKLKTIKSAYWSKKNIRDQVLRKTLLLE
ncbi:septum formation inhibitor Maf [Lacinutrix sp.]|uniref:septum formation inhibitor Maf n=1 Tax=Lacinutrix sp. TaxID=1937692 RepID=UPI0025B944A3|nr:septum formation inhibitor Maf [Lacinutrix sp.]